MYLSILGGDVSLAGSEGKRSSSVITKTTVHFLTREVYKFSKLEKEEKSQGTQFFYFNQSVITKTTLNCLTREVYKLSKLEEEKVTGASTLLC